MKIISRAGWGARPPRNPPTPLPHAKGVKVHYTGGRVDPKIVDDHDICLDLMARFQRQHMDVNGWSDFAYNIAACPHGHLLMGRGLGVMSAANGPGLNSGHYAVLGLVGSTGFTEPTGELLHALRDGIELLRRNGAGSEIKGHRDGYPTACPGDPLYRWVKKGAPRPGGDAQAKPAPKAASTPAAPPWPGRLLRYPPVMRGDDVRTWQARMRDRGWRLDVDGAYGPRSREVCVAFQREKGLAVDGIVGPQTWRAAWKAPVT